MSPFLALLSRSGSFIITRLIVLLLTMATMLLSVWNELLHVRTPLQGRVKASLGLDNVSLISVLFKLMFSYIIGRPSFLVFWF